ncbi:MAG: hypothetical protein ACRCWG_08485 [Sarcina sp.]
MKKLAICLTLIISGTMSSTVLAQTTEKQSVFDNIKINSKYNNGSMILNNGIYSFNFTNLKNKYLASNGESIFISDNSSQYSNIEVRQVNGVSDEGLPLYGFKLIVKDSNGAEKAFTITDNLELILKEPNNSVKQTWYFSHGINGYLLKSGADILDYKFFNKVITLDNNTLIFERANANNKENQELSINIK